MRWPRSEGPRGESLILADSSYFVALADERDRWHRDALRVRAEAGRDYLVHDLVVAEALTIVGARQGGKPARTLYEYFTDACEIAFADPVLLEEAMALHLRYDGSVSVADCVSVALMERRGIRTIVSFDRDFDKVRGLRRIH